MNTEARPTSIILCGGKALRFGSNKANACVGGYTVLDRIVRVLEPLSSQIIAVTSIENADIQVPGVAKCVDEHLAQAYRPRLKTAGHQKIS